MSLSASYDAAATAAYSCANDSLGDAFTAVRNAIDFLVDMDEHDVVFALLTGRVSPVEFLARVRADQEDMSDGITDDLDSYVETMDWIEDLRSAEATLTAAQSDAPLG